MKKALCVGLNYNGTKFQLNSSISDVQKVKELLSRNEDGSKNFDCKMETDVVGNINKNSLKKLLNDAFKRNSEEMDTILFYFTGHGYINEFGGFIVCSDSSEYNEGVEMSYLLSCITQSKAKNKVVILDCCHSGEVGNLSLTDNHSVLPSGVTILTSSKGGEVSCETEEGSVFTKLLLFALEGESKDIFGDITASNLYSYIDSSLGSWDQRPIFKTNISKSVNLRKVKPCIDRDILIKGMKLFTHSEEKIKLDPEFEPNINKDVKLDEYPFIPKDIKPISEKVKQFEIFQALNKVGLLLPTNREHMFYAAIYSETCQLTKQGQHYWKLVDKERI